jgi:DNA-binding transcriptional MerR regulator
VEAGTLQRSQEPRRGRAGGSAPDALPDAPGRPRKSLTIGAVCKLLQAEFVDVSISKIRYLEDQKLISPRRTPGGYRLYSPADVSRLRTILRLQRDEFLPLRVIRQELAAGRGSDDGASAAAAERAPRMTKLTTETSATYTLDDILDYTGVDERLVQELEDFGVIRGSGRQGVRRYDELEREIVRAVGELKRYGVAPRNLRVFRTSADREAALLEQILGPALRSRNRERRSEAVDALENLAAVVSHLKHLLLVRDLKALL